MTGNGIRETVNAQRFQGPFVACLRVTTVHNAHLVEYAAVERWARLLPSPNCRLGFEGGAQTLGRGHVLTSHEAPLQINNV